METLPNDTRNGSFQHKTQVGASGGYSPLALSDDYVDESVTRYTSLSAQAHYAETPSPSLIVRCNRWLGILQGRIGRVGMADASVEASYTSCSGRPPPIPAWYKLQLAGDEEGNIDLFALLEGYARLHADIVSSDCVREQRFLIAPDFKSGLGNTAMVFLGPLQKAMFLGRAFILPENNKIFRFFDFPLNMQETQLQEPYKTQFRVFLQKTKDSGDYWLPQKTLCSFTHMSSTTVGSVERGQVTLNDLEEGYISDPVINSNFLTINKKIAWLFPWFFGIGVAKEDQPFRQFIEKVQGSHRDAYGTIVRWLFRPKAIVHQKVDAFLHAANIPDLVPDFSVHIRFHNPRTHFFPGKELDAMWVWTNTLGKLLYSRLCIEQEIRVYTVFAATDQAETFHMLQSALYRWLEQKAKGNVDCPSKISQYVHVFQQTVSKREGDGDPMESMIDMFAFARAKVMLGTTFSTFSGFAMLFNPFPLQMSCSPDVYATCHFTDNFPYWHASKDSVGVNFIWQGHLLQPPFATCMTNTGLDLSSLASSPIDLQHIHETSPHVAQHRLRKSPQVIHFESVYKPMHLQAEYPQTQYFQWWEEPEFLQTLFNARDSFAKSQLLSPYLQQD